MKTGALLLALGATSLLLTGCTPVDVVMTSIQDGTLVFVPCEEITGVQHIEASASARDSGVVEVWHSRGEDGMFGPGHPVVYGVDPAGFTTDVGPLDFDIHSSTISFTLTNTAVTDRTWNLDGADLVEGQWLDQDGNLHAEPCS